MILAGKENLFLKNWHRWSAAGARYFFAFLSGGKIAVL